MSFFGGNLYVAGDFQSAGALPALRVAQWNGNAWSALGQGVGTLSATDFSVGSGILADAAGIYAAGSFTALQGGDLASGVARFNGTQWVPLVDTSDFTQIDGKVNAIAVHGNDVYVGGAITRVGEVPVNNVARWTGSVWRSLGSGANNGVDGEVFALSATTANVYVGGAFTHAGGIVANRVSRWDGSGWHALGSGAANGTDGIVRALASPTDAAVYAGGNFLAAGGQSANYVARWNGTAWSSLGGGGNGVCGPVFALASFANGIYVGGNFPLSSLPCPGAAAVGGHVGFWSAGGWQNLQEPIALQPGVIGGPIFALLVVGSDLYLGGQFSSVDTGSSQHFANGVVRWRNGAWNILGSPTGANPGIPAFVHSLGALEGKVYAGSGGTAGSAKLWRFNDDEPFRTWSDISSASTESGSQISALATLGSKLYVGGNFHAIFLAVAPGLLPSAAWALYQSPRIFADDFDPR